MCLLPLVKASFLSHLFSPTPNTTPGIYKGCLKVWCITQSLVLRFWCRSPCTSERPHLKRHRLEDIVKGTVLEAERGWRVFYSCPVHKLHVIFVVVSSSSSSLSSLIPTFWVFYARHCAKHFTYVLSFNLHNVTNLMCGWGNWRVT